MENEEYEIIRYRPEYKEQLIQLQTHLWGPDLAQNRAYFEWKYERSPYHQEPIIYLAICDGQAAAMRGFIGSRWQAGSPAQTTDCLLLSDSVTHPDHRRKGLFSKITVKALEDYADGPYAFIFNLSSGPLSTAANLKLGWSNLAPNLLGTCFPKHIRKEPTGFRKLLRDIPALYSLYRFARRQAIGMAKIAKPQAPLAPRAAALPDTQFQQLDAYFAGHASPAVAAAGGPNIWMTRRPEASRMIDLVCRNSANAKMRQVRDEAFYSWHYDNPRAGYRFLFSGGDTIDGYLVLRESLYPKSAEVKIVDWETSNIQVLGDLLRAAVAKGKFDAMTVWATTLSDAEKRLLQETNFSFAYEKGGEDADAARPSVLIKPLKTDEPANWAFENQKILDASLWDLRAIYSDGY